MNQKATVADILKEMDPQRFEEFIAALWTLRGWETETTAGSNDRGIDIEATRNRPFNERQLIQVKRHQNDISSSKIQQYASLQLRDSVDSVIVVTTSGFTDEAQNVADELNVKLVNGDDLNWIVEQAVGPHHNNPPSPRILLQWLLWTMKGLEIPYIGNEMVFVYTSEDETVSNGEIMALVEGYTEALDTWGEMFLMGNWSFLGVDPTRTPIWQTVLSERWGEKYLEGNLTEQGLADRLQDQSELQNE